MEAVNAGRSPVNEPGLDDLVNRMVSEGRLTATSNGIPLAATADVSLICVGTPCASDGRVVLDYVYKVATEIGEGLRGAASYHVVALRSTVPPGTLRSTVLPLLEEYSRRRAGKDFGLVSNPEFMREATAISDFSGPPYTVIGALDARSGDQVEVLYQDIGAPVCRVAPEEAELLKLANNAFHALKIGFANEIGRLSDRLGLDSHAVMRLVCADTKLNISPAYLRPGFAFGGSCLPKDLRALTYTAREFSESLPILEAVLPSNRLQIEAARAKIRDLRAQRVAILGLSFKLGTDDLRDSPVIDLVNDLIDDGVAVSVYDPDVLPDDMVGSNREYVEARLPQFAGMLHARLEDALDGAQAVVVTQDRPDFVKALKELDERTAVLDLVRLSEEPSVDGIPNYRGISW
jgi:GDP-mannose 6-dehydrogenase